MHTSENGRKYRRHLRKKTVRLSSAIMLLMTLALVVFFDLIHGTCGAAEYFPVLHTMGKVMGKSTMDTRNQEAISDQENNRIITDKEVEKAYKELLKKRRKGSENTKTLKAEKGSIYIVTLVSGKSLQAVQIQSTNGTVIITDSTGIVLSIKKQEIAGIKKVQDDN